MGCDSSKLTGSGGGNAGGSGGNGGNGGGEYKGTGGNEARGDGGRGGNQGYNRGGEEEDPIRIKKEPPMQLSHASSEGLRDGKGFSSAQFESTSEYDYLFKILLLGSQGVGKSSLLGRFADNEFMDTYRTTVGVDFKIRTVDIDDKVVKLQLWDTAGQERFKTVTNTYFRGAHGVIVVYDITDPKSFSQINEYWLKEVEMHAPPNAALMIVGNKSDLDDDRSVDQRKAKEFAKNKEALFLETSAKDGDNVNKAFLLLAETIKSRIH